MVEGRMIGMQINGNWIMCEVNCNIDIETDEIAVSPQVHGGWKEYIYGKKGWTASVDSRQIAGAAGRDYKSIVQAMLNSQTVTVALRTRNGVQYPIVVQGTAIIKSSSLTAGVQGKASYNMQFIGTSPLTIT